METCNKQIWKEYKRIHLNFAVAINQIRMITLASTEALDDFPNNLPVNIQQPFNEKMAKVQKAINQSSKNGKPATVRISTKKVGATSKVDEKGFSKDELVQIKANNFHIAAFILGYHKTLLFQEFNIPSDKITRINFDEPLFFQDLVMTIAHLEAFLDDSLRIICQYCPSVMKSGKRSVTWETLIDLGAYEKVINHLISEFVRKESRKPSLVARLEFLKNNIGLDIKISDSTLEYFAYNEQVRHIIVHNAGRIDKDFLLNTKSEEFKIGDPFPISLSFVEEFGYKAQVLGSYIFKRISKKFFDIPDAEMDWIWKFPEEKEE